MASQRTLGLLRQARLSRRQLIGFALVSAVINGIITASVGAWLGQTYAKYQARKESIESLVHLVYERRTRAGMVASALRRNADIEEVKYRKRAYDEAYVDWNKSIMQNIFAIREVTGEYFLSKLEGHFQDGLVAAMADVDRCLTKAYDARLAGQEPKPVLDQCRMPAMHQFVLDCGATFTNEIYKLTKLSFLPFRTQIGEGPEKAQKRIAESCTRPPEPPPAPATTPPSIATPPTAGASSPGTPPATPQAVTSPLTASPQSSAAVPSTAPSASGATLAPINPAPAAQP